MAGGRGGPRRTPDCGFVGGINVVPRSRSSARDRVSCGTH